MSVCAFVVAVCAATTALASSLTVQELRKRPAAPTPDTVCAGEFQMCPQSMVCVMVGAYCSATATEPTCTPGTYLCPPNDKQLVCSAQFSKCPNLKGTFWDWSLPIDRRLDLLVAATGESIDVLWPQLAANEPGLPNLYIPPYKWRNDNVHGVNGNWSTTFPDGCGMGATWSRETAFEVGEVIARESREVHHFYISRGVRNVIPGHPWATFANYGPTIYAPNQNLVRDPRWGRNQEVYGEDPVHMSALAVDYIRGIQQKGATAAAPPNTSYRLGAACSKHFLAYDVENFPTGRYFYNAIVDGRNLYESYLQSFRNTVTKANVRHIMCSYNSINGVPTCAAGQYLTTVLRDNWGFNGFVVSDYDAWAHLYSTHHYVKNYTMAAAVGINAGMDQEGGGIDAIRKMPEAMRAGLVKRETVIRSFRRTFRIRFELGNFDPPEFNPWAAMSPLHVGDDRNEQLALKAAQESTCIYRNERRRSGDLRGTARAIPAELPAGGVQSGEEPLVAVIGPFAASATWIIGNYAQRPRGGVVSPLEGIMNRVCPASPGAPNDVERLLGYTMLPPAYEQQYPPVAAASAVACVEACEATLRCNFYTFIPAAAGGSCYLLPLQGPLRRLPGAVSGSRHGQVPAHAGVTLALENEPPTLKTDDVRSCSQMCRADPKCATFSFNDATFWDANRQGACWLFPASRTARRSAPTTTSSGESPVKCTGVVYAPGCDSVANCLENATTLGEAAAAARSASLMTVFMFGLDQIMEAEGHDRRTIDLPHGTYRVIDALRNATPRGAAFVGGLIHGGAFRFDPTAFDAVLDFWYPGQQGGRAIAGALFGDFIPAGRSAITWYRSDADLPPNLAQQDFYPRPEQGSKGLTYRYTTATPLIPFGAGLTVIPFEYSNLVVSPMTAAPCDTITVTFAIRALGSASFSSDEVAQVYIRQLGASVPVPQIRLANFTRLRSIAPGAPAVPVSLTIEPAQRVAVIVNDHEPWRSVEVLEAGELEVNVGGGQPGFTSGTLQAHVRLTAPAGRVPLSKCETR